MKRSETAEIRVPLHLIRPLRAGLASRGARESAVFCLASHARLRDRTLLLVRKVIPLPEDAYVPSPTHGAKWAGRAMLPILNEALKEELGIILVHAHPSAGRVSLSRDDSQSASRLLPLFQTLVPTRPHASVVLGENHADGLALLLSQTDFTAVSRVRVLGKTISDLMNHQDGPAVRDEGNAYHRQALLTGSAGERNIRRARIAVVGLSGGGSHVVQQLAHMGVGEIVGIDDDRVEASNRSRLIGMSGLDALLRRRKTDVMARLVRRINGRVKFIRIPQSIPRQKAIDALKESDIVIGCVDSYHARADLQELAWRYMIPYVDIGLLIRPFGDDGGITIGGHVMTLIPGGFCQWCIDALSDEKLSLETGGRSRSYFQGTDKQAQVVSMNGVLASQAVSEVLQLLTAFAPTNEGMDFKKFDGLEGALQKWGVKQRPNCPKCNATVGAGDMVWH